MSTATTEKPIQDDWTMEVPKPGSGDYVLCPAGNLPATIVAVIDIGTHNEENDKKEIRKVRKLVLAYELKKARPDGKPHVLVDRYTWSMNEKAKFYGIVCGVTGRKFKEGEKFDPRMLLGLSVMINVAHSHKGEKTYHGIASIAQFPEGFDTPVPTMEPISWSIRGNEPLPAAVDALPFVFGESIRKLCEASDEGKVRAGVQELKDGAPF